MIGWLLNAVYVCLIVAVSPLLAWRAMRHRKYRRGWRAKLWGRLPRSQPGERVIWLHAVSVGEVLQLKTIIPRLLLLRPECVIQITTTTSTGYDVARRTFPECRVSYFPLDFTWAVRRAMFRVRPALIVLVELELWPNFVREAHAHGVPLALINGRISQRSYRGYRRIRWLIRPMLLCFARIAVQTEEYAARLLDLGAPPAKLIVTGSVKFDGVKTDRENTHTAELRKAFGISIAQRVFIAGSTHAPEERIALAAYRTLSEEFDDLRLVLVPRHAERFEEVAALAAAEGFGIVRRSEVQAASRQWITPGDRPVCLLDTLGELSA
ncbi:MAG: 3-deoxy-D-manno-octulosonic acid transferase, partial [Planctomycetaceae bacterium]|nr:3-deoxy-D-manno-octulosonic acid transferase [Planctomycetaceae bacterium]